MSELLGHMKLRFDPLSSDADPDLREIFSDELAKNLYLAIRQGNLVGEDFIRDCLRFAKRVKAIGLPQSIEGLQDSLRLLDNPAGSYSSREMAEKLLPYVSGVRQINYEIIAKK